MTGMQLAAGGGALIMLGVVLLVWRLSPAEPALGEALERLSPRRQRGSVDVSDGSSVRDRAGLWAMKRLPDGIWGKVPTRELALLRVSHSRFYGEKLLYALMGMLVPPLFTLFFNAMNLGIPLFIPVLGSVVGAGAGFFLPDYNVRDEAKAARIEFSRALGAYIDFVALERNAGAGPRQAMEVAAQIGDSWVFGRLAEELARTRWSGVTPWAALHSLAEELALPELDDLADIMRLSGEEGAQVYTNLRARSASMRTSMLNAEKGKAAEMSERLYVPMSMLGVVFLALLIAPSLLRVMGG
ncbi:type II secretion system F family protein [Janibacter alittae]|uniref:Type II secretion system F family protein n=1 Tax=Janibacter alittae TaxID=3115209 RepID=A0ABZ2MLA0_9MICO